MIGPERARVDCHGVHEPFTRAISVATALEQRRNPPEAVSSIRMVWPKCVLPNPERALEQRAGGGVVAHVLEQTGQIVQPGAGLRMLRSQALFGNPERTLEQRAGG